MKCGTFVRSLEEHFDVHAAEETPGPNRELARHAESCAACAERLRQALLSRRLLWALRCPPPAEDPHFFARLERHIRAQTEARQAPWLAIRWRDVTLAGVVFALTLTSFLIDVRRTETPDVSEAIALDVPHVHWRHPASDHRAGATDVLLSLLNP